ncbi:MAG: hypothetical protein KF745_15005 [Phycisphaeraceae bacterium]|nr:hypothetical protein [Phycisphaeraceae bacterium]
MTSARLLTVFTGLALSGAAIAQESPSASPPSPQPAREAAPDTEPAREFMDADDLLRALETADKDIRTLTASIRYLRDFGELEAASAEDRRGTLTFRSDAGPTSDSAPERRFAVDFDTLYINGQKRLERRTFIFDGAWLIEKLPDQKQMFKRRVVPPGQRADPLRIGEGPFPVPIGQKRADILARFEATLLPFDDHLDASESARKNFADTVQLRLVPREGTDEARDFREVRLWYRTGSLLPRMARTVNSDGGRTEVILVAVATNGPVDDRLFDTSAPPPSEGWNVEIREFRKPADAH